MSETYVLKADESGGKSFGTSKQRNLNTVGEDSFSQDVNAVSLPVEFNPFYSETGAVRVVSSSDNTGTDFDLTAFPADVVSSAVDVSDATGVFIYGAVEVANPPGENIEVVISPFALTSDGKPGAPLPRFVLRPISPYVGIYSSVSTLPEHFFREKDASFVRYAFDTTWIPTFGADRIGLYVTFSSGQTTEKLIIHAAKTSFIGSMQQLYTDALSGKWGESQFGEFDGES